MRKFLDPYDSFAQTKCFLFGRSRRCTGWRSGWHCSEPSMGKVFEADIDSKRFFYKATEPLWLFGNKTNRPN